MLHLSSHPPTNNLRFLLLRAALSAVLLIQVACVSGTPPLQPPYLREQGDFFMQAGIESFGQFNLALAEHQFTQAKNFYSRYEDYLGITNALLNLANTQLTAGNYDAANLSILQANIFIQRYQLDQHNIYRDMLLSSIYLATSNQIELEKLFATHSNLFDGDLASLAMLSLLTNRVRYAQLYADDSSSWISVYKKHITKLNDPNLNARLQRFIAWQAYLDNDEESGVQHFSDALEYYRDQANPSALMATHLEWADVSSQKQNSDRAIQQYEKALFLSMSNNHKHNGIRAIIGMQQIVKLTGNPEKLQQMNEWTQQLNALPDITPSR